MMPKKSISKQEKEIIKEKISNILKERKYIVFSYVFGSFAKEDNFRDIDLGIYVSDIGDISPLELELKIEAELDEIIHIPTDVRIINHAPLSFIYNILKDGILILDKDRSLRSDFEGLIFKKYFDFRHLRIEYLKEIINAPV
jgi:predicted nucleotidyltransferase